MKRWRFLSLSMPILVMLLFWAQGEGPDQAGETDVETLVALPVSDKRAPQWGEIGDRRSLRVFMRDLFPEESVPDVDFNVRRVLFLLNGSECGQYAGYRIEAYREDPGGGIIVFCEKKASSPSGQLVAVPLFQGEAVFVFR